MLRLVFLVPCCLCPVLMLRVKVRCGVITCLPLLQALVRGGLRVWFLILMDVRSVPRIVRRGGVVVLMVVVCGRSRGR